MIYMERNTLTVYLDEKLQAEISTRNDFNSESQVIVRDLTRLYSMYQLALRDISLTVSEAILICEVLNEVTLDINNACNLWSRVEEACRMQNRHKEWDIEEYEPLVCKLQALSFFHCVALLDAVERFWINNDYTGGLYLVVQRLFLCKEEVCPYSCSVQD